MLFYLFLFLLGCIVVVVSGLKLSYYGDVIGDKTGLEKGFIGFILLAFITSVPELTVSISAVTLQDSPNLSLGNVYGSNIFNIFILAIMDFFYKEAPIFSKIGSNNIVSASLGILIMSISALGLLLAHFKIPIFLNSVYFKVSLMSILVFVVYLVSMLIMYELEHRDSGEEEENEIGENGYQDITLKKAIIMFSLLSLGVIAAGTFLTWVGDKIAVTPFELFGKKIVLGATFVGSLFIAIATSLPEMVVSFGAIKLGQIDMAAGNVLGSNIFNVSIITVADIFYRKGSIFASSSAINVVTVVMGVIMSIILIFSLSYGKTKFFTSRKISLESIIMTVLYLISMYIIFIQGQLR